MRASRPSLACSRAACACAGSDERPTGARRAPRHEHRGRRSRGERRRRRSLRRRARRRASSGRSGTRRSPDWTAAAARRRDRRRRRRARRARRRRRAARAHAHRARRRGHARRVSKLLPPRARPRSDASIGHVAIVLRVGRQRARRSRPSRAARASSSTTSSRACATSAQGVPVRSARRAARTPSSSPSSSRRAPASRSDVHAERRLHGAGLRRRSRASRPELHECEKQARAAQGKDVEAWGVFDMKIDKRGRHARQHRPVRRRPGAARAAPRGDADAEAAPARRRTRASVLARITFNPRAGLALTRDGRTARARHSVRRAGGRAASGSGSRRSCTSFARVRMTDVALAQVIARTASDGKASRPSRRS